MLEFLRWISAADHSLWRHLEAAVLGWRFPAGTAALYEAIAADVRGEVRLGTPVAAVEQDGDGVTVVTAGGERHRAARAVVTVSVGVLPALAFTPPLAEAKRRAAERNHAGQGVKAWVIARGVPEDLCALGQGTRFDFAGAMATCDDGVLLVCFGPSAAELDVTDHAAVGAARARAGAGGGGRRRSTPTTGPATPTRAAPGPCCAPARCTAPGRRCARPRAASTSPARTPRCAGRRSWTARSRAGIASPRRWRRAPS